jgi:hypothetical protein
MNLGNPRFMSDRALKAYAYLYHYGDWNSVENAKSSFSYLCAVEQARREGVPIHEPRVVPQKSYASYAQDTGLEMNPYPPPEA